jgi:hypothetical protein
LPARCTVQGRGSHDPGTADNGWLAQSTPVAGPSLPLSPGGRIVVIDEQQAIRGRLAEVSADSLVVDTDGARLAMPFAAVRQIDRLGDSPVNGAAIGAALGGVSAMSAMALACGNTNCADTSANIDPRLTLLGTLAGAGIGALIDAAIDKRTTVYRSGGVQAPAAKAASAGRVPREVFVRFGWAGLSDDEGSPGTGASVGAGVILPLARDLLPRLRTTGTHTSGISTTRRRRGSRQLEEDSQAPNNWSPPRP